MLQSICRRWCMPLPWQPINRTYCFFCSIEMYENDADDLHLKSSTGAVVLLNSGVSSNHMVRVCICKDKLEISLQIYRSHHKSFVQIPVSRPDSQYSLETLTPEGDQPCFKIFKQKVWFFYLITLIIHSYIEQESFLLQFILHYY